MNVFFSVAATLLVLPQRTTRSSWCSTFVGLTLSDQLAVCSCLYRMRPLFNSLARRRTAAPMSSSVQCSGPCCAGFERTSRCSQKPTSETPTTSSRRSSTERNISARSNKGDALEPTIPCGAQSFVAGHSTCISNCSGFRSADTDKHLRCPCCLHRCPDRISGLADPQQREPLRGNF